MTSEQIAAYKTFLVTWKTRYGANQWHIVGNKHVQEQIDGLNKIGASKIQVFGLTEIKL